MAIMVTGGDGYVGSQCVLALLDSGYDVIILDNHSSGHSEISEHFSGLGTDGKLLENITGDLRSQRHSDRASARRELTQSCISQPHRRLRNR